MKFNISNTEKTKYFVEHRANGHNIFTDPNLWLSGLHREKFRKSDTFSVWFNIETIYLLLSKYRRNPDKITFIGDDKEKQNWCRKYNIKYISYSNWEKEMKDLMFTYTLMNSSFDITKECVLRAQSITKEKILFIAATRDFLPGSKLLNKLDYYEALGAVAFDEQILTALAVIDMQKTDLTTIVKFKDEKPFRVDFGGEDEDFSEGIRYVPDQDNKKEWLFAVDVMSKNLPTYQARQSLLTKKDAQHDKDGTLCVFTAGKKDEDEFGIQEYIPDSQLDSTIGLGEHNLIVSKTGPMGALGPLKYVDPETVCGFGCIVLRFDSKKEVLDNIEYLNSEPVKKFMKGFKTVTVVNGIRMWNSIPLMVHKDKWM